MADRPTLPLIVTTEPSTLHAAREDEPTLLPPAEIRGHARNSSTDSQVPAVILTPVDGPETTELAPPLTPSDYPPSPSSSSTPLAPLSSLALRDNHDPDGKRAHVEGLGVPTMADRRGSTSSSVLTGTTAPAYDEKDAALKEHASGQAAAPGQDDLAAGHVFMSPAHKPSFMARVPVVGRCFGGGKKAKKADADDEEKDGVKAKLQVRQLPEPTPEQLGPFVDAPAVALNDLVDPKSLEHLETLGGFDGLVAKLHADPLNGLPDADDDVLKGAPAGTSVADRRRIYGENRLPARKTKSLLQLMWLALQDRVLIILSIAAVISLALGLYQDLGTPPEFIECPDGPNNQCELPSVDWVEGLAIMVAIAIVVMVGSVNDYQKERQFRLLNAKKEDRNVKAIRGGGRERLLNIHEVVVGDVLELEPGEILPVDGVLISGHNVRADESSATGESDQIRKTSYAECVERRESGEGGKSDCFVLSGGKVVEGSGRYLVTAVGQRSQYGRLMMALQGDPENTPLQLKLNRMAEIIAWLGASAGLLLFIVLFIRFAVQLKTNADRSAQDKAQNFIQILIIGVTVIVVAVPEGLPLAVTLALAFATRRMTSQNLLVRVLGSCETMANATVVCTDKTGTLTTNSMSVVAGSIGVHLKFAARLAENADRSNANDDAEPSSPHPAPPRRGRKDFSLDMADINAVVKGPLRKLLNDSIAINSTAFEGTDEHGNLGGFVGSKTETALLAFAKAAQWSDYRAVRSEAAVAQMVPFSSERKAMGVVVKLRDGRHRLFLKGASEILTKLSTSHVVVHNPRSQSIPDPRDDDDSDNVPTVEFDEETRGNISRTIIFYASQSLRTIALCYRDYESWPPKGMRVDEDGQVAYEDMAQSLTLAAITAIEDPLRDGVTKAVADAQGAGVAIKMCTGDNVLTARSIATQCGIFTPGGLIMEGPVFRKLNEADRKEIVPRLQVLARSSPTDKELLVRHLREHGEVVGVTGDGLNDGPALKAANIGFSMGIAGTEVAKEASDIILMDDNFASIITAIMWGRAVNDAVRKFLQFQLSVNIVAVLLTFISAVASSDETSVLTAVQLLWVNLIMDTFAALALATDPATPRSLKRKPDRLTAPLISTDMWKMIVGQSIFQLVTCLVLHFAGEAIFGYGNEPDAYTRAQHQSELSSLVFNTFVWCQIFNVLNARELGRNLNIFAGFLKNRWFLGIWAIMIGGQALIVNVGGAAFSVVRLGGVDWAISIVLGLLSLPIGVLIRLIPTEPITRFLIRMKLQNDPNKLPTEAPSSEQYNEAISRTIDHLQQFSRIKGGRMRSSSFVLKSRSARLDAAGIQPSSLMAMVPTLVASTIGGGAAWRPVKGGSLDDPASSDPSRSTSHLFAHGISVHPETDPSDDLLRKYNIAVPMSPGGASSRSNSVSSARPPSLGTPSPRRGGSHSRSPSVASNLSVGPPIATIPEQDDTGHLRP